MVTSETLDCFRVLPVYQDVVGDCPLLRPHHRDCLHPHTGRQGLEQGYPWWPPQQVGIIRNLLYASQTFFQALLCAPHPHGYELPQEGHAVQQAQLLADLRQVGVLEIWNPKSDMKFLLLQNLQCFLSGRTSRARAPSTVATTSTTLTEAVSSKSCPVCPLS